MRLEQFQYLIVISQSPSLSVAAEKLHLTPQALSMSITAMEQELGMIVLNRTYKGVTLTAEGQQVVDIAGHFLLALTAIVKQSHGSKLSSLAGNYQILTTFGEFNYFFLSFLTQAAKDFPDCSFRVLPTPQQQIRERIVAEPNILAMSYNCQIDHHPLFTPDEALSFRPLFKCRLLAHTPRNFPLSAYKSVSLKSLLDYPLILYVPQGDSAPLLVRILQHFGEPAQLTLQHSSPLCQTLIASGQGIGLSILPILRDMPTAQTTNQIVIQSIRDDIQITCGLLLRRDNDYSLDVQQLINYLINCAQSLQ